MVQDLLGGYAAWFTVPAVVGTLYFLVQLFLMNAGGDLDLDFDADGLHGHDATGEIRVLSMQTISAFLMGGGWTGLAAYRLLDMDFGPSSLISVAGGAAAGWLMISMSKLVLKLQSSGNIELTDAAGLVGEVYVQVPGCGRGKGRVKLVVRDRLREFDAVQEGDVPLPSGTRVRVEQADVAANTLRVDRAD
ncbi:MAG TPA: hypothetical protein VFF69_04705 [Phycisphaerales bacterium]|nr:hypothetical protein [Phycisphaerales bacterium]